MPVGVCELCLDTQLQIVAAGYLSSLRLGYTAKPESIKR